MEDSARSTLQRWTVVAIALLAPTLGGSTERWSQGLILVLLASAVLLRPPRVFIGKAFTASALAALVLAALAWLPSSLWGETWWSRILVQDLGMVLPRTFSVQPWLSADAFILLSSGVMWLLLLGTAEWDNTHRRWIARRICAGFVVLTSVWLVVHYEGLAVPLWIGSEEAQKDGFSHLNFGPFPNTNQTAGLLANWLIIAAACATEDYRHGRGSAALWLFGVAVFSWGVLVTTSRASALLLFVGVAGWWTFQLLHRRTVQFRLIGSATVLVVLLLLVQFGASTLQRFRTLDGGVADPLKDYRLLIYRDAWDMALSSPWCGIGLGNFEGMFNLVRHASANELRLLHPESDWMWLLCEMGWIGPLLAISMVGIFVSRTFPLQPKSAPTLRSAALVGAIMFCLQGLVDVPGHRLGSAIPGLMLFGLAARFPSTSASSSTQQWVSRGAAAMLAIFGFGWLFATVLGHAWPGAIGAEWFRIRAQAANKAEHFTDAIHAADEALALAPLDWRIHFIRGVAHAYVGKLEESNRDFRRARRLEPSVPSAPYAEGVDLF